MILSILHSHSLYFIRICSPSYSIPIFIFLSILLESFHVERGEDINFTLRLGCGWIKMLCNPSGGVKHNLSHHIHHSFGHVSISRIRQITIKGLMKDHPTDLHILEEPFTICLLTKGTKIPRGPIIGVSKSLPGFMLTMDFVFKMLKASVDLPRIFWLYVLLLHIHLGFHPE